MLKFQIKGKHRAVKMQCLLEKKYKIMFNS
jgi:hypothetical protein